MRTKRSLKNQKAILAATAFAGLAAYAGGLAQAVPTFSWTGLGTDTSWTTPGNWSGGVVPTGTTASGSANPIILISANTPSLNWTINYDQTQLAVPADYFFNQIGTTNTPYTGLAGANSSLVLNVQNGTLGVGNSQFAMGYNTTLNINNNSVVSVANVFATGYMAGPASGPTMVNIASGASLLQTATASDFSIGFRISSRAVMNVNGGSVSVGALESSTSSFEVGYTNFDGATGAAAGTVNVAASSTVNNAGRLIVGYVNENGSAWGSASGLVVLNGGTWTNSGNVLLGFNDSATTAKAPTGELDIAGGTFLVGSGKSILVGASAAVGTLNVTSGTLGTVALPVPSIVAGTTYNWNANTGGGNFASQATAGVGTIKISGGVVNVGSITVNAGSALKLDFSTAAATNLINSSATLTLGGGNLNLGGNDTAASSQQFNGLAINPGAAAVQLVTNATPQDVLLSLGAISRNVSGTVDFTPPSGTISGTNGITTSTADTNGILGGWATINGTDWAHNNGTNIVPATYTTDVWGPGNNTTVVAPSNTIADPSVTNSLQFNTPSPNTVVLLGSGTITSGGILVSPNVGANVSTISGGTLEGAAGQDLIVNQFNTGAALSIASTIADNTTATALTKSGGGMLILGSSNAFTGGVYVNGGTLQLGNAGALNSTTPNAVTLRGAMLDLNANSVTIAGLSGSGTLTDTSGGSTTSILTVNQVGNSSFAGTIKNGATQKIALAKGGSGMLTLTGSNSFTGGIAINAGTLQLGNLNAINSVSPFNAVTLTGGTLDLNANSITVSSLAGTGGIITDNSTGSGTTLFTVNTTSTTTFAGAIQNGSGKTLSLTKTGTGTLALSGLNTYTGTTTLTGNGWLVARSTQAFGAPTAALVQSGSTGGTIDFALDTTTVPYNLTATTSTEILLDRATPGPGITQTLGTATLGAAGSGSSFYVFSGPNVTAGTAPSLVLGNVSLAPTSSKLIYLKPSTANLVVTGNVTGQQGSLSIDTLNLDGKGTNGQYGVILGNISNGALGTLSVGKTINEGTDSWILSGSNSYTGGTAISGGTLIARSANALGSGSVTVGTGAALNYAALSDTPLAITGTLGITGAFIGGSIGAGVGSAKINVTGNATATAAAVKVNIFGIGATPVSGTNTYTLLQGGGGANTLNTPSYTLNSVLGNTNFKVGALSATTSALQVSITSATALTGSVYWKGGLTGATKTWAASDGNANSNWTTDPLGTVGTGLIPNSSVDVNISSSVVTATPVSSVLGADMSIRSLTIADTTNGMGLLADGYKLTITPASSTSGITMNASVPASFIGANVGLGAAQTWTNNSTNALTISGSVSGTFDLTVAGSGNTAISGVLGIASGNLIKNDGGTLIVRSSNTFTGATTINAGNVDVANSSALQNSTVSGGGVIFDAAVSTHAFTFGGLGGGGNFALADNAGSPNPVPLTFGGNNANTSFSGSLTGAGSLIKVGTGSTSLAGTSTYSGATSVTAGTLDVSGQLTGSTTIAVTSANLVLDGGNALPAGAAVTGSGTKPTITVNSSQQFASLASNGTTNFAGGTSTIGSVGGTGTLLIASPATVVASSSFNQPEVANAGILSLTGLGTNTVTDLSGAGTLTLGSGVTLTASTSLNQGQLTNSGTANVNGTSNTIAGIDGSGTLLVGSSSTLNATNHLNQGAISASGTVNVSGGSSNVITSIAGIGTLAVNGGANLAANSIRLGGLSVGAGSTVTIAHDDAAATGATPTHTSSVTTLSINSAGTLDLKNNGIVILDTTSLGAVASLIGQAADVTAGTPHWDMTGITSSSAAADPATSTSAGHAVGFGLASALGSTSFNGITFSDAVIARYTLVGDHSLKGSVDLSDYTIVIQNLGLSGKTWTDGNFDYSGNVNLSDYTAVIKNIGRGDGQGVFTATGPSAQQVKASSLTLHSAPAVTQVSTATDVTLLVNPTNGRVTLINALQTGQAVITAYTINSSSGSLVTFSQDSNGKYLATAIENNPGVFYQSSNGGTFNRWTGIKNVTTFIGEGFSQNYNANNDSTWTNYTMAAGGYALGGLFKRLSSGGVRDLVFQWNDANQSTFTSVVNYVGASVSTPEPGSVSLIAMGAMGLLGRRRRRLVRSV